jgi:protein-disulfide isomerase
MMISMRNYLKYPALLLLSLSLFAQNPAPKTTSGSAARPADAAQAQSPVGAPSRDLVDAYFKHMFGYNPNIQIKVANISLSPIPDIYDVTGVIVTPEGQQTGHWFVSGDFKYVILGDIQPFGADPFAPVRAALAKSAFGPTRGPADAKLLIVEFADLECPACKDAAAIMDKLRNDFPQARFVFQSFPLPQLHPWAVSASSYLDCIARSHPDQAFTFVEAVFAHQKDIEVMVRKTDANGNTTVAEADVTERLRHYAAMSGADPSATQTCAESPATAERITRSQLLGQSIGITGTPTFFINGRRIGNPSVAQYEALKAVVAFEAAQAAEEK